MATTITPGTYTFGEVFEAAGFDFADLAAVDYLDGRPDYRRVMVGGLPLAALDEKFVVPATADELVISLDGEPHITLDVDTSDPVHAQERAYAFDVAALDANE